MIREYLKLARSYNAVLTGISPVMGAISMEQYNLVHLFLLFLVGFLGHTFGFILNDIMDYKIDKTSKVMSSRPLVSGTISIKRAWTLAFLSGTGSFIIVFYIGIRTQSFFPIIILIISAIFITIYDSVSKKYPFMDIFVILGIFFLIWGLWQLDFWPTFVGLILTIGFKLWYVDRMVCIYEDMKHIPEYEKWQR